MHVKEKGILVEIRLLLRNVQVFAFGISMSESFAFPSFFVDSNGLGFHRHKAVALLDLNLRNFWLQVDISLSRNHVSGVLEILRHDSSRRSIRSLVDRPSNHWSCQVWLSSRLSQSPCFVVQVGSEISEDVLLQTFEQLLAHFGRLSLEEVIDGCNLLLILET